MSTWKITPSRVHPGRSVIIGPYDPDFVDALKAELPTSERSWDPGLKAWVIADDAVALAQRVIDRFTPGAVAESGPLTIPELVEAARGLGDDVTHEAIMDGVLLGVSEVYDQAEVADAVMVERDGALLIVVAVGVRP